MTKDEAYKKLAEKTPVGYKINELIPFHYPVKRIKMDVLVNKEPDGSLVKVYAVMLKAIQMGFDTREKLFEFLGLGKDDDFMLRELHTLHEMRYVDIVSGQWVVTAGGKQFMEDTTILRVEEEEVFEFFIDGISGGVMFLEDFKKDDMVKKCSDDEKRLEREVNLPIKSPELIEGKFSDLSKYFKEKKPGEELISYDDSSAIKTDYDEWCKYWLIEYKPDTASADRLQGASLEVRSFKSLEPIKSLTKRFNADYQHYVYELTDSDRADAHELSALFENNTRAIQSIEHSNNIEKAKIVRESKDSKKEIETLTIFETENRFFETLKTVKEKILIESPWIKRVTWRYIPCFKKILEENKILWILYGIAQKDEHDIGVMKQLEELQKKYSATFHLIHLPTHFRNIRLKDFDGSHRKLTIKDDEYFISGSFNFLSCDTHGKNKVGNEESYLFRKGVKEKWEQVMKEYSL